MMSKGVLDINFLSHTKTIQHEHGLENAANFSKFALPYWESGEGRIFPKL
jgi:hypothetical protein